MTVADALRSHGIEPRHFGTGTQRLPCPECATAKHRTRDTALALTIESDGCAVWLCHRCGFKGGTNGHARDQARTNTAHRQARRAEVIRLDDARQRIECERHATKAEQAREIWRAAGPASVEHPYLLKKRLPGAGLRQVRQFQSLHDSLIVSMRDASGAIVNLQGIDAAGEKRFLAGAQTRGAFACVGPWEREAAPEMLAIGEGWATVAAFIMSRRAYRGVAALSAHNLPIVAKIMRDLFPAAKIAILADQDSVGVRAATFAQIAAQADFIAPGFRHAGVKDFSDLWIAQCREAKTVQSNI